MDEQEFERDEQLLEARRLKRLELRRKRVIRSRIFYGVILLVLVLIVVLIVRACGAKEEPKTKVPDDTVVTPPVENVQEAPDQTATLSAVGDLMIYDSQLADALQPDGSYNFLPALAPVAELLTASDLTVGNFEANFGSGDFGGYPNFIAPPALATTLAGLGFDILQTANTYSVQNGLTGRTATINTIREAGISTLGTYLSADDKAQNGVVIKEAGGIKFAFVGFTKGLNNMSLPAGAEYSVDLLYTDYDTTYSKVDKAAIVETVAAAKAASPDVIVAMVHWGSEGPAAPSASQKEISDLLIENGVDVILGSHPHVVGPMEQRTVTVDGKEKQVFLAYSLGNFMGDMQKEYDYRESLILNLEFTKDGDTGDTVISAADYVPLFFLDNGQDAADRFQVVNIYDVLADSTVDEATRELLQGALPKLAERTVSSLARANTAADGAQGGAAQ